MKQKTCAEILTEIGEKIDKSPVLKAACIYSDSVKKPATIYGYGKVGLIEAFKSGAEWQAKQSSWISVKDRLPEENTCVFFILEWRGIHKEYFAGSYKGGKWETEQRTYAPYSFWGIVTHWMPIPEFNSL